MGDVVAVVMMVLTFGMGVCVGALGMLLRDWAEIKMLFREWEATIDEWGETLDAWKRSVERTSHDG